MLKVIALGNALRGDDGIGPAVLERLQSVPDLPPLKLIDAATDAMEILDHLLQPQEILLIDCATMGERPGTIRRFKLDDAILSFADQAISLHGFGLAEIVRMAELLGRAAPCSIIGIEPQSVAFNQGLSAEVENCVEQVTNLIIKEAKANAKKNNDH